MDPSERYSEWTELEGIARICHECGVAVVNELSHNKYHDRLDALEEATS